MQFLLQLGQAGQFFRLVAPLVETFADGIVDFQTFVQEDANQIVVTGLGQSLAEAGGLRHFLGRRYGLLSFCRLFRLLLAGI